MRKVITYGTFDLFHQGHYNILKRAKEEGDYLIVGVTGENYDLERGKLSVQDSLAKRIENVQNTGFADLVIVEEYLGQKIQDIIKYNVDVLVIGSDWKGKFDHLSKYCEVKYLERTKNISSTQIREENLSIFNLGIVTDDMTDNDCVIEPKHVSGIHVESVFAESQDLADNFAEKYELANGYSDYGKFLDSVDIVYIKTRREDRLRYTEEALKAKKHVVCEPSLTLDAEELLRLDKLAQENGALLLMGVTTLYLNAFGQLLWMVRGNLIGDIISIKCSISRSAFGDRACMDFVDLAYYPVSVIVKSLGTDIESVNTKIVKNDEGNTSYGMITMTYDNVVATAEISNDFDIDGGMSIIGTRGKINVPDDWWNVGYFKLMSDDEQSKRYSSNHSGNGYRYLFQALVAMMKSGVETVSYRIDNDEALAINSIVKELDL